MIELGSCDADTTDVDRHAYLNRVEQLTRVPMARITDGCDKLAFDVSEPGSVKSMTVRQAQQALVSTGFFPGGELDGIFGYRTLSALRLFQEYVRTVEGLECAPDGLLGPQSEGHLSRWIREARQPAWAPVIESWRNGDAVASEYRDWLQGLELARQSNLQKPGPMHAMVTGHPQASDTRPLSDWSLDPRHPHLIGIRRDEFSGKFDDIFVLLIAGMVFKFQGSTQPGASSHPDGTPFLMPGQHDYHFGWHQRRYLALRPQNLNKGVLIVRSRGDRQLDENDLKNGLEANPTINIHWGGKGGTFNVNRWSAGCQVINGSIYIDHDDNLVDCAGFVATNNRAVAQDRRKTRGAYNMLVDLISVFTGGFDSNTVKYTLLNEADLSQSPALLRKLANDRDRAFAYISTG